MQLTHYFIYILRCQNDVFYTGYTTNLERRYREHLAGTDKCKFTRSFKPLHIAQSWHVYCNKSMAMKIEKTIKLMNRKQKEVLVSFPEKLVASFPQAFKKPELIEYD